MFGQDASVCSLYEPSGNPERRHGDASKRLAPEGLKYDCTPPPSPHQRALFFSLEALFGYPPSPLPPIFIHKQTTTLFTLCRHVFPVLHEVPLRLRGSMPRLWGDTVPPSRHESPPKDQTSGRLRSQVRWWSDLELL